MTNNTFDRQIEAARLRLETLQQQVCASPEQTALMNEALEELANALEELHVAGEELRQQNDELAASRQAVEAERQRYQELFDFAPDGYLVTDTEGVIQEANRAAAGLLGVRQDFLVGKSLLVFVADTLMGHKTFHTRLTQLHAKRANIDGLRDWQIWLQPREGAPFPVELTVGPVRDADGQLTGLRWLLRDITRRKRAAEALQMSEAHYRAIVEDQTELILRFLPNGSLTFVNGAYCRYLGKTHEEVTDHSLMLLMPIADWKDVERQLASLTLENPVATYERRAVLPGGKMGWQQWTTRALFDDQGNLVEYQSVGRDITERRQMEEALRERTHALGERVKELHCLYSISALVEQPDISLTEILGGTLDLIPPAWQYPDIAAARIFVKDQEFRTPNLQESVWRQTRDVVAHGERIGLLEVCYLEERPTCDEGPFLKEERSLLNAIAGRLGRILERVQAQEALQKSEERYRRIVETAYEGIWVIDAESKTNYVNGRMAEMLGYPADEIMGKSMFDFMDGDWQAIAEGNVERRRQSIREQHDFQFRRKDGAELWAIVSANLIFEEGHYAGALGMLTDITERKRAEEALHRHAVELQARNEELDAYDHTVAHDLNNPVSLLVTAAESLEDDYARWSEEEVRRHLRIIARGARTMGRIIDELLLLASVRKAHMEIGPLDMAGIVAEAYQRLAQVIEEYQAKVTLPDMSAWPVALGHAEWIVEVWVNYLGNAIKYGGEPPQVELGAEAQPDGMVRFWVRDDGQGLTREDQVRLFTPFTRLDQVRAKGHGLGLSIVRRIVEKLGGQAGVQSHGVPGQGSSFFFTLSSAVSPATPTAAGSDR